MSETFAGNAASSRDWKAEYYSLVEKLGLGMGEDDANRKHPRFRFAPPEKTMMVHIGSITGVLNDISAGGFSFLSPASMTSGRQVSMNFDQRFSSKVKIVSSTLEGSDYSQKSGIFRTGTRFVNADDGYRCVVRTLRHFSRTLQI